MYKCKRALLPRLQLAFAHTPLGANTSVYPPPNARVFGGTAHQVEWPRRFSFERKLEMKIDLCGCGETRRCSTCHGPGQPLGSRFNRERFISRPHTTARQSPHSPEIFDFFYPGVVPGNPPYSLAPMLLSAFSISAKMGFSFESLLMFLYGVSSQNI